MVRDGSNPQNSIVKLYCYFTKDSFNQPLLLPLLLTYYNVLCCVELDAAEQSHFYSTSHLNTTDIQLNVWIVYFFSTPHLAWKRSNYVDYDSFFLLLLILSDDAFSLLFPPFLCSHAITIQKCTNYNFHSDENFMQSFQMKRERERERWKLKWNMILIWDCKTGKVQRWNFLLSNMRHNFWIF